MRRLWRALSNLLNRRQRDRDLDDELHAFLTLREDELRARGVPAADAARRARLELGGVAPVTETIRAARAGAALEGTWQDVRYALRGLRRAPAFALTAIGTLALGIGANLAVFAVVDAAVFKPLPYAEADRLVEVVRVVNRGRPNESRESALPWDRVDLWRSETRIFDAAAVLRRPRLAKVGGGDSPESTLVGRLSPDLLQMLDVQPQLGRWFSNADLADASPVVLLTDAYWRTHLGASRAVVGTPLAIDGRVHTIVGVMPASFAWRVEAPVWPVSVAGWVPLDERRERAQPGPPAPSTIFRLRGGLSLDDARIEVASAAARHAAAEGAATPDDVVVAPLDDRRIVTRQNVALFVLLAAVGVLVLIACVNVASMVMAQSLARQRELSLRAAIGASRGRLVRQALTESLVLATIAGAAAVAVAGLSRGALVAFVPAELGLFRANPAAIDGRAIAVCAGLVLAAAVIGALPAVLRTRRPDLGVLLAGSERSSGRSGIGRAVLTGLQSVQVALAVVLLAACMLLAASFIRLVQTDLGFDPAGLAYVALNLPADRYPSPASRDEFRAQLIEELRRSPSIASASYGDSPPGSGVVGNLYRPDDDGAADRQPLVRIKLVDPDAFAVIGQRIVAGRPFRAADSAASAPVAIIDAAAAERLYPGESPVGRQIRYRRNGSWLTIVGVVSSVRPARFGRGYDAADVYRPYAQADFGDDRARSLLVRDRDGQAPRAIAVARAVVRRLNPSFEVVPGGVVLDAYGASYDEPRFHATLMSLFAGLALATAAVGLFGLLSFSVVRRRHEIGVRMALGASRVRVRAMLLRDALAPVVGGAAVGLVAAFWMTRALGSMLYETTPSDPASYAAALGVLALTAAAAAWLPARRATRVDPAVTLRE